MFRICSDLVECFKMSFLFSIVSDLLGSVDWIDVSCLVYVDPDPFGSVDFRLHCF